MVRFKNRYALCELIFPDQRVGTPPIDTGKVYAAIKHALLDAHGDFGLGALQFSLSVKYLNIKTNIAIIRGERKYFDMLASSIVFVRKIGNYNVILKTLHKGGSIRACQKFLIRYHRHNMPLLFPNCKTEEQRARVMQSIVDACDEIEVLGSKSKSTASATSASTGLSILQGSDDEVS